MTPTDKFSGSDFEDILIASGKREEKLGRMSMRRNGVTSSLFDGRLIQTPSLADFTGVLAYPTGRAFDIEAKVCAHSNFPMNKDKIKPKQVASMLRRARFGCLCYLVVHFTPRNLVRTTEPAFTVAIPVLPENPMWQEFVDAYAEAKRLKVDVTPRGSISRDQAVEMGTILPWTVAKGSRKPLPDLMTILDPTGILRGISETPKPEPEDPDQFSLPI